MRRCVSCSHGLVQSLSLQGKIAFVRHIEPTLCVDGELGRWLDFEILEPADDLKVLSAVRPYIEDVVHVSGELARDAKPTVVAKILTLPTLAAFFAPSATAGTQKPSAGAAGALPSREHSPIVSSSGSVAASPVPAQPAITAG